MVNPIESPRVRGAESGETVAACELADPLAFGFVRVQEHPGPE